MTWAARLPRSLFAVFSGCALVAVLLRIFGAAPAAGFVWFTISAILAAIAGGFLTAWLAGSHEIPHAAAVGFLLIAATIVNMVRASVTQPGWPEIVVAGCGPIATMLGASLRILTRPRRSN